MFSTLFGKKKLKEEKIAQVFVNTINSTALEGFPTLAEYINDGPDFKESPKISPNQVEWFLYIVFAANLYNLKKFFPSEQLNRMRLLIIDEFIASLEGRSEEETLENINNYEAFIAQLKSPTDELEKVISKAVFYKYGLNRFQIDHFQRLNAPNPVVMKALSDVSQNFVWNWEDVLGKYKLVG